MVISRSAEDHPNGSWAWNRASGELFWSREHFRIFGLDPESNKVSYHVYLRMCTLMTRAG